MSNYSDFVHDYPKRCHEVLSSLYQEASKNEREVTLLLCTASAGLVTPYERLRENGHPHPSRDHEKFDKEKAWLDEFVDKGFLASQRLEMPDEESWKFKTIPQSLLSVDVEKWGLESHQPLPSDKKVKEVLDIVRNALAHGSVFTNHKGQIKRLAFISYHKYRKPEEGFDCLSVSPDGFKVFLDNWFTGLINARNAK